MRRLLITAAMLVMAAAGIASASVVSAGWAEPVTPDATEAIDELAQIGETVPDPRGGPPWAVRISTTPAGRRCVTVGRTDGRSFGPVDAAGAILATRPAFSGSCADPADEPLHVALARYAASGDGARSVLFGVADASVVAVTVTEPGEIEPVAPDRHRTFVVVREGLSRSENWTVMATLNDGTVRTYRR